MGFLLLVTLIYPPETLSKFRSENRTWNHGNRRNQKLIPTDNDIVPLWNHKWIILRKSRWNESFLVILQCDIVD